MRQKFVLAMMFALLIVAGCNKPQNDPSAKLKADAQVNASKKALRVCTFDTLSGNITASMTLSAAITYKLSGIVVVKSPAVLTVPAGTVFEAIQSTTAPAWLVIEKGAKLVATGTSTNPIIFTSDGSLAARAPGDWGGIVFAGSASNNNSNSLTIRLSSAYTVTGGGTNDADNSGNLQYVQVHFGGAGFSTDELSKSALVLNSIGTATDIDHVQITNSKYDGIGMYGGLVDMNNIVSYDEGRTDYPISYGYRGNIQFITAMRMENTAVPTGTAYGLEITNQTNNDVTTAPVTKPVISNLTVLGPNYCSPTTVDSQFDYAVRFSNAAAGKVYNSVFSAWKSTASHSGLLIDRTSCFDNTASRDLVFSYNSFDRSGTSTAYFDGGLLPWSGSGCSTSMAVWITGTGTALCRQAGNQFSVSTLGYDNSFCSDYCTARPSLVLGSTTLSSSNYTWDTGSLFNHVTYRGAFGATDFTSGWTEWCAKNIDYCM